MNPESRSSVSARQMRVRRSGCMKENAAVLRPCGGPFPETASWSSRLGPPAWRGMTGLCWHVLHHVMTWQNAERVASAPPIYPPCAPAAHKRLRCFPTMYLRRCGRIPPALPPYLCAELTLRLARWYTLKERLQAHRLPRTNAGQPRVGDEPAVGNPSNRGYLQGRQAHHSG